MPRKKNPSFLLIFGELITDSVYDIVIAFVSGGYLVYRGFNGELAMLEQIPVSVWWAVLGFFILRILVKGVQIYRKELEKEKPNNNNHYEISGDGIVAETVTDFPVVKAEGQGRAAGRDINETHFHYYQKKTSADQPQRVNLDIEPQGKPIQGEPYIIVVIKNLERERIYCRMEIHGIYNEAGENILRNISQFANHFSWSGGRASEDGMRLIEPRLDGTINIVNIRHGSFNFYWQFHEDPNKNWLDSGKYKLDMAIRGVIGVEEFSGIKLTIEFEYVPNIVVDDQGDHSNQGKLILLDWKIIDDDWLMI